MIIPDLVVSGVGVIRPPVDVSRPARDWFDYRTELGQRGYKHLPGACRYLLGAAKRAMADAADHVGVPDRGGVVIGTNSAVAALHGELDRTIITSDASALSPVFAPHFSINLVGSRLATEYGWRGFNLTLTTPRVAGLETIVIGTRALALGRADWLLVGAAEEALDDGEPGASQAESGAVALIIQRMESMPTGQARGRCQVFTGFLAPETATGPGAMRAASELLGRAYRDVGAGQLNRLSQHAVLDDSPVSAAIAAVVGRNARATPAGAGCLSPMDRVADAFAAGTPTLVITAVGSGHVAVAHVEPFSTPAEPFSAHVEPSSAEASHGGSGVSR